MYCYTALFDWSNCINISLLCVQFTQSIKKCCGGTSTIIQYSCNVSISIYFPITLQFLHWIFCHHHHSPSMQWYPSQTTPAMSWIWTPWRPSWSNTPSPSCIYFLSLSIYTPSPSITESSLIPIHQFELFILPHWIPHHLNYASECKTIYTSIKKNL